MNSSEVQRLEKEVKQLRSDIFNEKYETSTKHLGGGAVEFSYWEKKKETLSPIPFETPPDNYNLIQAINKLTKAISDNTEAIKLNRD